MNSAKQAAIVTEMLIRRGSDQIRSRLCLGQGTVMMKMCNCSSGENEVEYESQVNDKGRPKIDSLITFIDPHFSTRPGHPSASSWRALRKT